ncbi:MAG: D-aminoacyl-tRNA deacylase [Candidatus Korarchaeota archaeon]
MRFHSVIVTSAADPAGRMIRQHLLKKALRLEDEIWILSEKPAVGLYEVEKELLYIDQKDLAFDAEFIVFGSRHKSEKAIPSLLTHPTGNWGIALYGGKDFQVSVAAPWAMKAALQYFSYCALNGFQIGYEVTHHGPLLDIPHAFVEIGSSVVQWEDVSLTKIVAEACYTAAHSSPGDCLVAVGIGGTHYAPRFTCVALNNKDICFGHMIPRYAYPEDESELLKLVNMAISRSGKEVKMIVLDSRKDSKKLKTIEDIKIPILRAGDLCENRDSMSNMQ